MNARAHAQVLAGQMQQCLELIAANPLPIQPLLPTSLQVPVPFVWRASKPGVTSTMTLSCTVVLQAAAVIAEIYHPGNQRVRRQRMSPIPCLQRHLAFVHFKIKVNEANDAIKATLKVDMPRYP